MRAGVLKYLGELQRSRSVRQPGGGYIEQWEKYAEPYAEIKAPSGRTAVIAQQIQGEITAEITIRYRDDIKIGDRFVYKNEVYRIEAPLPDNFRREIKLMCSIVNNP